MDKEQVSAAPADREALNLDERCRIALECLPDAQYREMLARLLSDLRAAAPAAVPLQPVAWMQFQWEYIPEWGGWWMMRPGKGFGPFPAQTPAASPVSAPEPACQNCDGTGDVHRADGEWLGACGCEGSAPAEPPEVVIHVVVNGHQRNITIRRDASLRALAINALIEAKVIDYDLSRWVVTTEAGEVLDQSRLVASIDPKATPLFIARTAGIVASSAPAEPAPAPAMVILSEEEIDREFMRWNLPVDSATALAFHRLPHDSQFRSAFTDGLKRGIEIAAKNGAEGDR
jgi:hypothetical protein